MKKIAIFLLTLLVTTFAIAQRNDTKLIRLAVQRQMHTYPKSTLQDLYKNFFQDSFGLEHLMGDSAAMRQYIIEEAQEAQKTSTYYEKIGYQNNFYRVSLALIKDSIVSVDDFMHAFMQSKQGFKPITIDSWKKDWQKIDSIIYSMRLNLDNYESDRKAIFSMLRNGSYALHHSKQFNAYYHPHYRIIEKKAFESILLPLIEKKENKTSSPNIFSLFYQILSLF